MVSGNQTEDMEWINNHQSSSPKLRGRENNAKSEEATLQRGVEGHPATYKNMLLGVKDL